MYFPKSNNFIDTVFFVYLIHIGNINKFMVDDQLKQSLEWSCVIGSCIRLLRYVLLT